MKLIFENWRKFINEETVAFHGYKMEPEQMRVPACDSPGSQDEKHGYADKQWTTDDEGRNHVNILKHKSEPQSGRLLSQEEKEKLVNETNP